MNFFIKTKLFVIVFLFFFFAFYDYSDASSMFLSTAKDTYEVGDTIQVNIYANSNTQINAYSATLSFPVDKVSISSISKSGSIVNVWAQEPTFSASNGIVSFEGVTLNGFSGRGLILTVNLKAKKEGSVSFLIPQASILANDGLGTETLTVKTPKTVNIIAKKIVEKVVEKPQPPAIVATTTPEEIIPEPIKLIKPRLVEMPQILQSGEQLVVKGYANPNVKINFKIYGKEFDRSLDSMSDNEGSFEFMMNDIPDGEYKYYLFSVHENGARSEDSQLMNLKVGENFWEKTFEYVSENLVYILVLIIILLILFIIFELLYIKRMHNKLLFEPKIKPEVHPQQGKLNEIMSNLNSWNKK